MPTSELSDALNPYYAQPRSRPARPPPPHRSELELAISEPPRPPTPPIPARPTGGVHAVQELMRFLASTREAHEIEQRRRMAWEQEQEAKYKLRQAEMERRMLEMQQEISALKARVAFNNPGSAYVATSQQPTPSPTLSHSPSPSSTTRFVAVNPATGSDSEEEVGQRVRRRNHHDTRCLTIQHAMRSQILRVMALETDKGLPDSHIEGTAVGADEPVRFVWDKTPRQSVHNGRMKERVLKDLKANRRLYKHVSDKDFGKKTLDSVFDQAFVTLRQKFKAQRDESTAQAQKQREEVKAQRARRLSRRKVKLGNRSDARNKMAVFEHVAFDGALQLECMSSEESEVDEDGQTVFRIRGVPWRSARMQRFFDALDEADSQGERRRRGVGRRERYVGAPKEGVPAAGVARWMVSKGWPGTVAVSEVGGVEVAVLGAESE